MYDFSTIMSITLITITSVAPSLFTSNLALCVQSIALAITGTTLTLSGELRPN